MKNNRYFIILDYNGSVFHGWQIQPNAISVQEVINNALSKLLRDEINLVGCGRTDTGVHARNFVAHFNCANPISDTENIIHKLNSFLPKEISIHKLFKVKDDKHCRFDAIERTYKYYVRQNKDVFDFNYSLRVNHKLNVELMNQAAKKLFNYSDFTSFSKIGTETKTNNCKIMEAFWESTDNQLVFTIKADRFLRNMVRAIVGTLLEVGKENITVDDFCQIIEAQDRCQAKSSAPAHALSLTNVKYPYSFYI